MADAAVQGPAPAGSPAKGLRPGALSLAGSVVVGVASTAPAYSLAATLGFVVAEGAGFKAPAIMLLAFIPMYFIAVAYRELNAAEPDCGTTFTWATRTFGPITGWMGGWGIIVADVICMANLAQIAGAYSFVLADELGLHNHLASNLFWATTAGVIWIIGMTWISYRGIQVAARLQNALLSIEILTLVSFVGVAMYRVMSGTAPAGSARPSLSWLWPGGLSMTAISTTVLLAVFIYWGWDSAVSTNEEADDPGTTPGRAAVISTVLLVIIYVLVTMATVAFAGIGETGIGLANPDNAADVFSAIGPALYGDSLLGRAGLALLAISILTSSAASTQTTILPTARTALSMGVFKALPEPFARIHPVHLTPTWATIGMGVSSVIFYLAMTLISANMLAALIGAIGLQIAFYYGLTGFACVWFYRRTLWSDWRHLMSRGIIPLAGGIFLFIMFWYAVKSYAAPDYLTDTDGNNVTIAGVGAVAVVGVVSLVGGVIPMALQWWSSPDYFRGRTLPRASHRDLVLVTTEPEPGTPRLPDSHEYIVIAPDRSNLPPGAEAVEVTQMHPERRDDAT